MTTLEAPLAEELVFGDVRIPREFVIQQQGREYVLSDGLLVALGQLSRGFYDVDTTIVQLPTAENANTAVVTARVVIFEPESGRTLRCAGGIGDASPANVGRLVALHVLRMAETRAVARALRHLLGVGMTAMEELGAAPAEEPAAPRQPDQPVGGAFAPYRAPVPGKGPDRIDVEGKWFDRAQVLSAYKRRVAEAQEAGLTLAPSDVHPDDAPLAVLVGAAQALKRRLEVRAGARPPDDA